MKFDMPSCGGCRTCELACSLHWRGAFVPAASSLKILEKNDGQGYVVLLKEADDADGQACDHCASLVVPMCLDYCREYDELFAILQKFKTKKSPTSHASELEGLCNVRI